MSTPLKATRPDCGAVRPMIERIVVDLPTPLRPSRQTHSPVVTSIETPNSTRDRPYAVWMSRTASSGALTVWQPRGAPRLRRGASERWGVWGAGSGPPTTIGVSPALSEIDAPHLGVRAHVGRRAVGDHEPLVQHGDLLRDGEDDLHVVLGEQQRQAALARDAIDQADGLPRLAGRHAGPGPVEQQDVGLEGQGQTQLELLLRAVREEAGDLAGAVGEPQRVQQAQRLVAVEVADGREEVPAAPTMRQEGRLDIREDGQLREDIGSLERAADAHAAELVRRHAGDVAPVEGDPARVAAEVAGDQVEERRLAGAVGPDDGP